MDYNLWLKRKLNRLSICFLIHLYLLIKWNYTVNATENEHQCEKFQNYNSKLFLYLDDEWSDFFRESEFENVSIESVSVSL